MFGIKLRSWMEAHIVRPRRRQPKTTDGSTTPINHQMNQNQKVQGTLKDGSSKLNALNTSTEMCRDTSGSSIAQIESLGSGLSSPESAYSTGYSTDGTSPGTVPPTEYSAGKHYTQFSLKISKKSYKPVDVSKPAENALQGNNQNLSSSLCSPHANRLSPRCLQEADVLNAKEQSQQNPQAFIQTASVSLQRDVDTYSPRQRNGIRTNPWLTGVNIRPRSIVNSSDSLPDVPKYNPQTNHTSSGKTPSYFRGSTASNNTDKTITSEENNSLNAQRKISDSKLFACNYVPADTRKKSPRKMKQQNRSPNINVCAPGSYAKRSVPVSSSYSTSSDDESILMGRFSQLHSPKMYSHENNSFRCRIRSDVDDEDEDTTLNEMMGKFDESYVYEKETDILSDSDPTDCEQEIMAGSSNTDTDTGGEEAGDEYNTFDDMDFIDDESTSTYSLKAKECTNTVHCTYHELPCSALGEDENRKQCNFQQNFRRKSAKKCRTTLSTHAFSKAT